MKYPYMEDLCLYDLEKTQPYVYSQMQLVERYMQPAIEQNRWIDMFHISVYQALDIYHTITTSRFKYLGIPIDFPPKHPKKTTRSFTVTFLGWLSDLFKGCKRDLQR